MSNPKGHAATIQPPPNPIKPGEARALTHGCNSERTLQPLRERHARELRQDYPHLDGRRVALVSDLLARIDLASEFVARTEANLINRKSKRCTPIAEQLDKWSARASAELRVIEAEQREAGKRGPDALEEHLRRREAGEA